MAKKCYSGSTYIVMGGAITAASYLGITNGWGNWNVPDISIALWGLVPVGVTTMAYGVYKLARGKKCRVR